MEGGLWSLHYEVQCDCEVMQGGSIIGKILFKVLLRSEAA